MPSAMVRAISVIALVMGLAAIGATSVQAQQTAPSTGSSVGSCPPGTSGPDCNPRGDSSQGGGSGSSGSTSGSGSSGSGSSGSTGGAGASGSGSGGSSSGSGSSGSSSGGTK
jgi:hypothetical protein